MPDRTYRGLLWALALVGLIADQATKYGIFSWLEKVEGHTYVLFQTEPVRRTFYLAPPEPEHLQRGFFLRVAFESELDANGRAVPHVNQGALFGFLREHKTAANGAFAVISLLAAAAIVFWSTQKHTARDRWLCVSLGLILAGTLGNFYDRLMFNGVRDFLHWHYLFNWPVFNLADCCLVVGASLLLVQAFFAPQPAPGGAAGEAEKKALSAPVAGVSCAPSGTPQA